MESAESAQLVSLRGQFEFSHYPFDAIDSKVRAVVSLKAEEDVLTRAPIDLCAVVDRSGSMRGSKLDLVKEAIKFMVNQLGSTDRLSVVSFDCEVQDTYGNSGNMNFMTSGNKKVAMAAVDRIQAGGGTNLSAGLFRAVDHHQLHTLLDSAETQDTGSSNRVKSVFLFSDGISSVGVTDRSQLISILSAMLRSSGSPKLHTFGFGSHFDQQTLNDISEKGGGHCICIQDAEAIPAAFATSLGGLMSINSQNVELSFAPQACVRIFSIDTSFKQTVQPDSSINIVIGDLYAGEQKDLLLELELPAVSATTPDFAVLMVEARYLDVSNACMQRVQLAVTVARTAGAAGRQRQNSAVLQHVQRCETSSALQAASAMADAGNLSGARDLLASTEAEVSRGPASMSSARYTADLRSTLQAFQSQDSYHRTGRNMSRSLGQEHSRQQTSFVGSGRVPMYQSVTGQSMYQAVSDTGARQNASCHRDGASAADVSMLPVPSRAGSTLAYRQLSASEAPDSVQKTAHSTYDSNTSTVDYRQQDAVSSGGKRKFTQIAGGTQLEEDQPHAESIYNTRAKAHKAGK